MPTPIQSSSVTAKLRSFFRLRGRQIFTLDETAVPVVAVEDLTTAPYRQNHQVRWKCGNTFTLDATPARRFLVVINTSSAAFIDLTQVPGVAVIEAITLQARGTQAPITSRDWIISLVNHQGVIMSVEPGAVVTTICTDVDAPVTVPVPALGVRGQVPVRLSGVNENVAPNLGTLLRLGRFRLQDDPPGPPLDVLGGSEVTIGDNVAVLIKNSADATAGTLMVNVSGSYYPLARS